MSRSVHLNDRKAAYHVPHRQATDICHLQSFILPLPASAPITNNHTHKHPQRSPSSESPLPKHLCHLSLSSLKPFAALLLPPRRRGMKRTRWAKREREDRGDDSFIWEGSYVLKGAALAAKTFLWHVSNWYFEMAAHSAEVMGQFPSSADWEMRLWC